MVARVAALLGVASISASAQSIDEQWQAYKLTFDKVYNGAEDADRFNVFKTNVEFINSENTKGNSWTLGLTPFADLTSEEWKAQYLGYEQPAEPFDGVPDLGNHTWDGEELPSNVDWSSQGAVTGVKNQGSCGSCWAFSTTGSLEGAWRLATGSLISLSEQQFVDCAGFPNMGCNGGNMGSALGFSKKHNVCSESSYRYEGRNGQCRQQSCTVGIPKGRVSGVKNIAVVPGLIPATEMNLKSAVAKQPVSVAIEADKAPFQHYAGGVLTGSCGGKPDHGVLVVGYGHDSRSNLDFWKVKNSWGASWGESGYVRIQRGKGLSGECAILSQPVYPVIHQSEAVVV